MQVRGITIQNLPALVERLQEADNRMRREKLSNQETTMTLSDLTSKTPEELNVMCAELCGYKYPCQSCYKNGYKDRWRTPEDTGCVGEHDLPNYTGSWDAIMPEVRRLNPRRYRGDVPTGQWERYVATLLKVVEYHDVSWAYAEPIHITIALILTLTSQH